MAMSKKDYQAIAREIHTARDEYAGGAIDCAEAFTRGVMQAAVRISVVLAQANPYFDRARFLEACETGTTKGMPKRGDDADSRS